MTTITKYKHEIMWWMSRLTIMVCALCFSIVFASTAYAADAGIQMGANGNLIFEPNEVTVNVGDTVTFTNGDLPPHNVVFLEHDELSHSDLAFMSGEQFPVTFTEAGNYEFQCEPHAGAGMKGVIHVE
jgi:plastocyanin